MTNTSKLATGSSTQLTDNTSDLNLSTAKDFAMQVAKIAGIMIRSDFGLNITITTKADGTPVTPTDKRVNKMVIDAVKSRFPDHDILGEEESDLSKRSNRVWVCDPLDGTQVFSLGIPTSVFSLALVIGGRPVVGVVLDPFTERFFSAETGKGAFLNGEAIKVSQHNTLEGAIVGVSTWKGEQFNLIKMHEKLREAGAKFIDQGSIAYMGALVACGKLTGSIHPAKKSWDSAALKIIVEEAGGRVTDLFKNEQRYDGNIKGAIISNGLIHNDLGSLIRGC